MQGSPPSFFLFQDHGDPSHVIVKIFLPGPLKFCASFLKNFCYESSEWLGPQTPIRFLPWGILESSVSAGWLPYHLLVIKIYTTIFKMNNQQGSTVEHRKFCSMLCGSLRKFGGEWICVYVWLSLIAVHLKLSQHCSLASSDLPYNTFFDGLQNGHLDEIPVKLGLTTTLRHWQ